MVKIIEGYLLELQNEKNPEEVAKEFVTQSNNLYKQHLQKFILRCKKLTGKEKEICELKAKYSALSYIFSLDSKYASETCGATVNYKGRDEKHNFDICFDIIEKHSNNLMKKISQIREKLKQMKN